MLLLAGIAGAQTWKDLAPTDPAKTAVDSVVANSLMFRCGTQGSEGYFCHGELVSREDAAQSLERTRGSCLRRGGIASLRFQETPVIASERSERGDPGAQQRDETASSLRSSQ